MRDGLAHYQETSNTENDMPRTRRPTVTARAAKLRGKACLYLQVQFEKLRALSGYSVTKCGNHVVSAMEA